ncbi:A disintegrin and metalloproteinase with thrombospondin motifs like [Physella acuta]|uniref:A disintegrin and metalloproteinase with thrombospondin motifs like n=1 Tax=Physella acuta TaxID=109671 RepID=UPI0027DB9E5C|nr:A disintegrin and metalloproteinase with thrombospondin motifs like [Physella acuta]
MIVLQVATWLIVQLLYIEFCTSIIVRVNYTHNDVIDQPLPDDVNVTVTINDTTSVLLQLKRVRYVGLDTPVYTITTDKDGRLVRSRESPDNRENIGYYQDVTSQAALQIQRIKSSVDTDAYLQLRGEFVHSGLQYSLTPNARDKRDITSQDVHYNLQIEKWPSPSEIDYELPDPHELEEPPAADASPPRDSPLPPPHFYHRRRRRQARADYYIDVTAMLDFWCWSKFLTKAAGSRTTAMDNVREYYAYIFNTMDLLYQSITTTPFKLNIRLTKIVICETVEASYFSNNATTVALGYVDGYATLDQFAAFVKDNGSALLTPYDHVMLFIGLNMTNTDRTKDISGRAYVATTCRTNGDSTSVIEDMGNYRCISTATHELGHSLSAQHDGEGNNCSVTDRYIMAGSSTTETTATMFNPWRFSNCSISYFTTYVNSLLTTGSGVECLSTQLAKDTTIPDVKDYLPGLGYSPSQQCVLTYGPDSYDCRLSNPVDYCRKLYCYSPVPNLCYLTQAMDGTTCGSGKLCRLGECVADDAAPVVDDFCIYDLIAMMIGRGVLSTSKHPLVDGLVKKIESNPNVKTYLANRKKTDF